MSPSRNRAPGESLPWLADEPSAPTRRWQATAVAGWVVAIALFTAGAAYWLTLSSSEPPATRETPPGRAATLPLHETAAPGAAAPGASKTSGTAAGSNAAVATRSAPAEAAKLRESRPERLAHESTPPAAAPNKAVTRTAGQPTAAKPAAPQSVAAKPAQAKPAKPTAVQAKATEPAQPAKSAAAVKSAAATARPAKPLLPSASTTAARLLATPKPPVRQLAYNSLVNLAAFRDARQGHAIWHKVVAAYPAAGELTPGVIQNRDWNGRLFYQFQIGTASRADSEVLCRSVQSLDLRCEVVNLP